MSHINISNFVVKNNPCSFLAPFAFSVTFECLQPPKDEIEWKVIYVGSPKDESYDQVLDSFSIGPLTEAGVMQFDIEPSAPDYSKIPVDDLLGVAAIIHTVSYQKQEFFRVGYFVYNNYEDPFLVENPPNPIEVDKVVRSILADKPRIIRHNIDWESDGVEKVKALQSILIENQNLMNTESGISFKGMFSDVDMNNQPKSEDNKLFDGGFNNFSWNNNNSFQNNNGSFFNNNNNMMSGGFGNQSFGNGFSNNNQQQYNSNPFMGQSNGGGFSLFSNNQSGNDNYGMMDINAGGQRFGNGFIDNNNMGMNGYMQNGMNFPSM